MDDGVSRVAVLKANPQGTYIVTSIIYTMVTLEAPRGSLVHCTYPDPTDTQIGRQNWKRAWLAVRH